MSETIEIPASTIEEAFKHARVRIEFEYDRFNLDQTHRVNMIALGTIGQLIFRDYLDKLGVAYEFEYQAGNYDAFDFKINDKNIEIKTSGFEETNGWQRLNAIYNQNQIAQCEHKQIFGVVQIFINGYSKSTRKIDAGKCKQGIIAGWTTIESFKVARLVDLPYGRAYMIPLGQMKKISDLISVT
jgi:hypothetical protein